MFCFVDGRRKKISKGIIFFLRSAVFVYYRLIFVVFVCVSVLIAGFISFSSRLYQQQRRAIRWTMDDDPHTLTVGGSFSIFRSLENRLMGARCGRPFNYLLSDIWLLILLTRRRLGTDRCPKISLASTRLRRVVKWKPRRRRREENKKTRRQN